MAWTSHELADGLVAETIVVGFAQANCYIVREPGRRAVVIDPGSSDPAEVKAILNRIEELGLSVELIINTHGHPDHMAGNDILKQHLGVPVAIHELDAMKLTDPDRNGSTLFGMEIYVAPPDRLLRDDETIALGEHELRVVHTPGHSVGGIVLVGNGFVVTGDTLFAGSIGRSDLPCASEESSIAYEDLIASIRERLMTLPDETIALPGHGPVTTIGRERRTNPYIR